MSDYFYSLDQLLIKYDPWFYKGEKIAFYGLLRYFLADEGNQ